MKKKIIFIIIGVVFLIGAATCIYLYQFTEVFGKKIIPVKVEKITIRYVPGASLDTVEIFNKEEKQKIDIQEIQLKNNELDTIKKALRKVTVHNESIKEENKKYELLINDKVTLQIGEKTSTVIQGKKKTIIDIPSSSLSQIESIMEKNDQSILKELSSESATVKIDGASITIKSKNNLKLIQSYLNYYPITIESDYKTYQDGYKAELFLDNNVKVYLYDDGISYIQQKEEEKDTSTYALLKYDLYGLLQRIYTESTK